MTHLKYFFCLSFVFSLMLLSMNVSSNERADHQKLKRFLDCELKGEQGCELKKPKVADNKETPKKEKKLKKNVQTRSQNFIFGPRQKRTKKGNASAR